MAKNKTPNKFPSNGNKTNNPPAKDSMELSSKSPEKKSVFAAKSSSSPAKPISNAVFVFGKSNYQWMFIGIGFLILGFFLMSGTQDIMSNTKIVIAPLLVLIGFGIEFYAILLNPLKKA